MLDESFHDTLNIIGLVGKKQAGKDTFFSFAEKAFPAPLFDRPPLVLRLAFADALKEEIAAAYGTNLADIEARKAFFRPLLQWWGCARRAGNPRYWIERFEEKVRVKCTWEQPMVVVVTDVRFMNEAECIKSFGKRARLIRIEKHGSVRVGPEDTHISETEQDGIVCDRTIQNHHNQLEIFRAQVLLEVLNR